jgi:hypothetical protein
MIKFNKASRREEANKQRIIVFFSFHLQSKRVQMENGVSRKGKLEMILRKANDWRVRIILRMIKSKV